MKKWTILVISLSIFLFACKEEEQDAHPKPMGYFQIEMPKNEYQLFDTACPYSFEYSKLASVIPDHSNRTMPYWNNIEYKKNGATIHLSYRAINNNLDTLIGECQDFATKHQIKANAFDEVVINDPARKVYGLVYFIGGNTASNLQFYVTDSSKNFVRGALYFNCRPNIDSVKPVFDYIKTDVNQFISTLKWK